MCGARLLGAFGAALAFIAAVGCASGHRRLGAETADAARAAPQMESALVVLHPGKEFHEAYARDPNGVFVVEGVAGGGKGFRLLGQSDESIHVEVSGLYWSYEVLGKTVRVTGTVFPVQPVRKANGTGLLQQGFVGEHPVPVLRASEWHIVEP